MINVNSYERRLMKELDIKDEKELEEIISAELKRNYLTEAHKKVIILRYGLEDNKIREIKEIAIENGVSVNSIAYKFKEAYNRIKIYYCLSDTVKLIPYDILKALTNYYGSVDKITLDNLIKLIETDDIIKVKGLGRLRIEYLKKVFEEYKTKLTKEEILEKGDEMSLEDLKILGLDTYLYNTLNFYFKSKEATPTLKNIKDLFITENINKIKGIGVTTKDRLSNFIVNLENNL